MTPQTLDTTLDRFLTLQHRWWSDRCKARGLTTTQVIAMYALAQHRRMRMARLASRLFLTPGAASTMIMRLEAQGLAERLPDPRDGRAVVARLTPAGRRLLRELLRDGRRRTGRLLLDLDPEVRRQLLAGLTACVEALDQVPPSALSS